MTLWHQNADVQGIYEAESSGCAAATHPGLPAETPLAINYNFGGEAPLNAKWAAAVSPAVAHSIFLTLPVRLPTLPYGQL